ncbi:phospholipase A2 inhibitor CNF-like [Pyxicephalus adspersus]|uniref:phospholipase A2 inhibitor CNF-like n=1 Tax=Pyxicephalus adspersus TaxID=30357 RepID=UPI003B596BF1
MKTFILMLILFTFSFSLDVACGVMCYKCEGRNTDTCTGEKHQCPEGSVCMTVSQLDVYNGTYHSVQRRCSLNLPCNTTQYAFANENTTFDIVITCCEGDLCNDGPFQMPEIPIVKKGYECPVCSSVDIKLCTAKRNTTCRNESDKCGEFVGLLKRPDGVELNFTAQGCGSHHVCTHDFSQLIGWYVQSTKDFRCYDPKKNSSLEYSEE